MKTSFSSLSVVASGVLAACGGGSSSPDAFVPVEIDAPADGLATHRYVVSQLRVPTNNTQARELGLDLDGDGVVDNQLGMVLATLAGQGFDTQAVATAAIDRGEALMLAELRADSLMQSIAPATFTLRKGANPMPPACAGPNDTTCRKHLTGSATFQIAADAAQDAPLSGAIAVTGYTGGPGHLQVLVPMMSATPVALDLVGARAKLQMLADGSIGSSVIAGGIKQSDIDTKIYPQIAMGAMAAVARDCTSPSAPDCGCGASSEGKTWIDLLDTAPKNCQITVDEVKGNTLFQSLFAPDVTLEGQQALSIGIGITAVGAKFVR